MQRQSIKTVLYVAVFIVIATTLITYYLFSKVYNANKPLTDNKIDNKNIYDIYVRVLNSKANNNSKVSLNTAEEHIGDTVLTSRRFLYNLRNITGYITKVTEEFSGHNSVLGKPLNNTGLKEQRTRPTATSAFGIPDKPFFSYGKPQKINGTFKILYWTGSSHGINSSKNWFGLGRAPFNQCEYQNCVLTENPDEYNNSDAVLIYLRYVYPTPEYRFPWQKWIMRIHEPPPNEVDYTRYNFMFNATWTYHTKSDIYSHIYYKRFVKIQDHSHTFVKRNFASGRNRAVAWFVSQCQVQSKRMRLVKELRKYTHVDVFGKCGSRPCGKRMSVDCDHMLSKNYKFYLSFENSLCEEYVTEKLWRAFNAEVVPIVMGAANYSFFLPPHSYINVADFRSVRDLAEYIEILDRNDDLYNAYFKWKRELMVQWYPWQGCPLCKYLNLSANMTTIYHRLDLFWNEKTDCTAPELLYKDLFSSISQ